MPAARTGLMLTLALAAGWWSSASAADDAPLAPKVDRADPRAKMSSALIPYLDQPAQQAEGLRRLRSVGIAAAAPDRVTLRLDVPVTADNLAAIAATGALVTGSSARWNVVKVEATFAQAAALAQLPMVHAVILARPPRHRSQPGTYTNQGDAVIHTDQLRTQAGVNGAGRTVGLISDSFNQTSAVGTGTTTGSAAPFTLTGTIPQNSGNLPASITVIDFGPSGGTDEGEAMTEECFHIAPGAAYAFASAGAMDSDMATNIASLASKAGCKVICDDVGFFDEPMFQDGPIAQAVEAFVQGGGIYLSAAGNSSDAGISASYQAMSSAADPHTSGPPSNGNSFHNWGIGGATAGFLPITIVGNKPTIIVTLQWNQPYASFGLGRGSQSDYDIYLYDSNTLPGATILAGSNEPQGTAGAPSRDPVEVFQYTSPVNGTKTVYLAIDHYAGLSTAQFRVVFDVPGNASITSSPNYATVFGAATVYGHCAAADALAIAAVHYTTPGTIEPFSSKGGIGANGLPFYFDTAGNALAGAPQRRDKPDLAAPDGVTTSNANFAPFFGTSAATPNAAAAATLIWSAQPTLTNTQVIAALRAGATDITAAPASAGNDAWSGSGLVNATASFATVPDPLTIAGSPAASNQTSFTFTCTFARAVTGFGAGMITVTGGTAGTFTPVSGTTYTLQVTATSPTVTASVAAGVVHDASGCANAAAAGSVTYDTTAPTLTITPSVSAIETGRAFSATLTFSEPVVGFTANDISVAGGTAGFLTGSGAVYTLPITAGAVGTLTIGVAAGVVPDAVGNSLAAAASAQVTVVAPSSSSKKRCGFGSLFGLVLLAALRFATGQRSRRATDRDPASPAR